MESEARVGATSVSDFSADELIVEPEWIWQALVASRYLTLGSGFLLVGALPLALIGWPNTYGSVLAAMAWLALTGIALFLHGLGWMALRGASERTTAMRVMFWLSVIAYVVGLVLFFGGGLASTQLHPALFIVLVTFGWFLAPYVPLVYGMVVIFHGALFLMAFAGLQRNMRHPVVVGSLVLVLLGSVGLGLHFFVAITPWASNVVPFIFFLAGSTMVGYGLIAVGLETEYETWNVPVRGWFAR